MWHVSSRSGVATLRTVIHLLLTYFNSDYNSAALGISQTIPVHFSAYADASFIADKGMVRLSWLGWLVVYST